jgi:predicted ATPase/DNA-binding SARP family transcriptional activator/DNA-binding CsgD family transcriptional regulator
VADRGAKINTRSGPKRTFGTELEALRVRLLGGFSVSVGSRTIQRNAWRLRRAAALVKLLTLAPRHRLHREQVLDALWPDSGKKAASNSLRKTLHAARRALDPVEGSRYLASENDSLVLCPSSSLWVDVEAFEEAASTARREDEPAAYRAAIDLYAGDLLPEDRYEEWAQERRRELRRMFLSLLIELAGLYEERKEYGSAIEVLSRVVAEEPTHEGAHVGLMRLYALLGRRREGLGQYERLREALTSEFGTEPEAAARYLQQEIWAGTFPPARSPPSVGFPAEEPPSAGEAARHNLPSTRTSFVGRERETREVRQLLAMTGLLTLTGAGGCGKTRLALEVARDLVGAYPDGVWLVELAPLSDPTLIAQAVAQALSVREQPGRALLETLKDTLRTKKILLVVDNCEHLVEAVVHLVDALLSSCPKLRILATSRESLNATGEVSWVVPSLSVPEARQKASTAEELEGYESVRLFVERARQRDPSFVLTPRNATAMSQTCRRLDGMPLAIELAAARAKVLSVEQIAGRLDESLGLLTAGGRTTLPRQKTLRATIDWSYALLSEDEQTLFRRLSAFAGGFTLEAAEAVCAGGGIREDEVLDLLSQLVDKSLVMVQERGTEARYRLLETVRQYGWEKLYESGVATPIRSAHADFFLILAEDAESKLKGAESRLWLERLELEHDNLRAALRWAADTGGRETELRLVAALWWFWIRHDHVSEGRRWLEDALERAGPSTRSAARARVLCGAGFLAFSQIDHHAARSRLEESAEICREIRDRCGLAYALTFLSLVMAHQGDLAPARLLAEEGVRLFREEVEDWWGLGIALTDMGIVAEAQSDYDQALPLFEESAAILRELGDRWFHSIPLRHQGVVASRQGDHARAESLYRESLASLHELGEKWLISLCFEELAGVACAQGEYSRATRLWGAEETLCEAIGSTVRALYRADHERDVAAARADLGEEAFESAWAQGRAMNPERALEYALSRDDRLAITTRIPEQASTAARPPALTRREREVAKLVALGLTNRQISEELSISERTVDHHVSNILKKLNLSSREQVAPRLDVR